MAMNILTRLEGDAPLRNLHQQPSRHFVFHDARQGRGLTGEPGQVLLILRGEPYGFSVWSTSIPIRVVHDPLFLLVNNQR